MASSDSPPILAPDWGTVSPKGIRALTTGAANPSILETADWYSPSETEHENVEHYYMARLQ